MKKLVNNYKYGVVISLLFVFIFYIVIAILHSGGTFTAKFSTLFFILLIIPVIFVLRSIVIGYILIQKNKSINEYMLGIIINLVIFGILCYLIYWSLMVFSVILNGLPN